MIRKISLKCDEDPTWFKSGLNLRLGGHWGFLTGDLEDGVIFDIIDLLWGTSDPCACQGAGQHSQVSKLCFEERLKIVHFMSLVVFESMA